MRAYMGYDAQIGREEGAILIFAHSVKEAKKIGRPFMGDWFDSEFIDIRIKWLKDRPHLFEDANQIKLDSDTAHVIESPKTCERCELWGLPMNENGICEYCQKEIMDNESDSRN